MIAAWTSQASKDFLHYQSAIFIRLMQLPREEYGASYINGLYREAPLEVDTFFKKLFFTVPWISESRIRCFHSVSSPGLKFWN